MKNHKEYMIFGLVSIIFISSVGIIFIFPTNIHKKYNQIAVTSDEVLIAYDIFEPKYEGPSLKTAIILGHGVMVNKNFMRTIAIDLASQGFVAVAFDFRGHGRSGGSIDEGDIIDDILAIKAILADRGDINMTNLGYVGYSMGGGAGFRLLDTDTDFRAMVSLAAGGRTEYSTPNLLILHGKWDEAFRFSDVLEYMEVKTGISSENVKTNHLYGSFDDGTALKVSLAKTDHLLAPYNYVNVRETRFWLQQALLGDFTADSPFTYYFSLLFGVMLATISGIYLFLLGTDMIIKRIFDSSLINDELPIWIVPIHSNLKKIVQKYFLFVLPLCIPCMVFALPLLPIPIFFMVLFCALLIGPSTATLFYQFYILKKNKIRLKDYYKWVLRHVNIRNSLLGVLFGMILYIIFNFSLGYIFGIIPTSTKWGWAALFFIVMVIIQFNYAQFFQPIVLQGWGYDTIKNRFQGQMNILGFYFIPIVVLVLLSLLIFQSWFNLQFLLPLFPLVLLGNLISGRFYKRCQNVSISVITNSVYLTLILITLVSI